MTAYVNNVKKPVRERAKKGNNHMRNTTTFSLFSTPQSLNNSNIFMLLVERLYIGLSDMDDMVETESGENRRYETCKVSSIQNHHIN